MMIQGLVGKVVQLPSLHPQEREDEYNYLQVSFILVALYWIFMKSIQYLRNL